jgi:inward rectifier potassium channel
MYGSKDIFKPNATKSTMSTNPLLRKKPLQTSRELGFGTTDVRQRRLINSDGSYNFIRHGIPFHETFNVYHYLLSASWLKLIMIVIGWYSIFNFLFVGLYYAFCPSQITGMIFTTEWERFWEIYFFSAQTLTTVGYGRINPTGIAASAIASLEALTGLMSFALITGLLFARFAKSPGKVKFAEKAVIAPFVWNGQEVPAFMLRTANPYKTNLMNLKAQITISLVEKIDENGAEQRRFYPLTLERNEINFFPSSWTLVHPIDEESPVYGFTQEDLKRSSAEFMVLLNAFDETFDQNVFMRYSYGPEDIEWGAKYVRIFNFNERNQATVDLSKLGAFDKVQIEHLLPKFDA